MSRNLTNEEKLKKLKEHQAAITRLKEERAKEVVELLQKSEGLFMDDELLVGFARYSLLEKNKDTKWLTEIYQLGKTILPSKKTRSGVRGKKSSAGDTQPEAIVQKGA